VYVLENANANAARGACLIAALLLSGCGAVDGILGGGRNANPLDLSTVDDRAASTVWETGPNSAFDAAEFVDLTVQPVAVRGRLDDPEDVDVFDLGPVLPGDRVFVEMSAAGDLEAALALFDDGGAAQLVNDHRNVYLGRSTPFIDVIIRRPADACWVTVAATPGFSTRGDYALMTSVQPGLPLPDVHPDVVLLDFRGGSNVRIGSRSAVNVPPFDASNISREFSPTVTDAMIRQIVATVREDYEGFNVTILSTSEGAADNGLMTRLYFGTYDPALLGVAEGVDEFNADTRQSAIVFTDTFSAFMRLDPTVSEMSQAVANVASHEIGHLLGLVHTDDPAGLMDVTASLRELTKDQHFRKSPLYSAVFPIGFQDAVQSLLDSVGGDPSFVRFKESDADRHKVVIDDDEPRVPARAGLHLSTCGAE
jgi:hypothetical protein